MEWFFYINHFSLIIFHHSVLVGVWTIRLSAGTGAHIEYISRSCAEDMTITNVIIKNPYRKWDWGVHHVMPGSERLRFSVIFEKGVSWDLTLGQASSAAGVGVDCGGCRNSHHSKSYLSLSLSSCRKTKSQEVNKRFVPEQRESSVFRISLHLAMLHCHVLLLLTECHVFDYLVL